MKQHHDYTVQRLHFSDWFIRNSKPPQMACVMRKSRCPVVVVEDIAQTQGKPDQWAGAQPMMLGMVQPVSHEFRQARHYRECHALAGPYTDGDISAHHDWPQMSVVLGLSAPMYLSEISAMIFELSLSFFDHNAV